MSDKVATIKTEIEFKYYYMWWHLKNGDSFDPYDVEWSWDNYQTEPIQYEYLFKKENS